MCRDCHDACAEPVTHRKHVHRSRHQRQRARRRAARDGSFDPWAILRDLRAIEALDAFDPDQLDIPFELLIDRQIGSSFPRPSSCEE